MKIKILLSLLVMSLHLYSSLTQASAITIGGKRFTENYILAEIMAQLLESKGETIIRKFGMNSKVAFEALKSGEIDLYPAYTGTLARLYLKEKKDLTLQELRRGLDQWNLSVLEPFGFNNTYALAIREDVAKKESIHNVQHLLNSGLQGALSFEFSKREDGWVGLRKYYGLELKAKSMEHSLTYKAIQQNSADFIDIYSTDPKVKKLNLRVLKDNKSFFPSYEAIPFVRSDLKPKVKNILIQLSGLISEKEMIELNLAVEDDKKTFHQVASDFLTSKGLIKNKKNAPSNPSLSLLLKQTRQHLFLTCVAVLAAVLIAVPLSFIIYLVPLLAPWTLSIAGILQTLPSIALLAFMIPVLGIGAKPAIAALFLFSLLPIMRNTYTALMNTDASLLRSAQSLGLNQWQTLRLIQLPLALPLIVAGVRTAATICIGTATLAAFIGAGGLGESIVSGLAINDNSLILQGAVPAALLAVLVDFLFGQIENRL